MCKTPSLSLTNKYVAYLSPAPEREILSRSDLPSFLALVEFFLVSLMQQHFKDIMVQTHHNIHIREACTKSHQKKKKMVLLGSACLQNNLINEMYQISSKLGFFCKLRKADTCQDLIGSF